MRTINDYYTNQDFHNPEFYRLSNKNDQEFFNNLLKTDIEIFDQMFNQLCELVKSKNPKKIFSKEELNIEIEKHLDGVSIDKYGVWVYYPWTRRLVHLLDEEEFVWLRTNRNNYKIKPEEQKLLHKKKIGIIGLSIGHSIAVTIVQERICGELRIADYDTLELNNMNRIRTGVHNIGLSKTIIAVREIYEIDPFIKISFFNEGINEDNILRFLTSNGKLDLLVEVCDGLHVKVLSRQMAKAHHIPVIMDTSDRGMIDVERFDLEPDRPILHGLIDHLDLSKLKLLKTNEEKVPYLLPIVGAESLSLRARVSMVEVGQTISSWPQLASAVTYGGGLTADVCRRILLDQFKSSGRYYMDPEDVICDKKIINEKSDGLPFILNDSISEENMLTIIHTFGYDKQEFNEQLRLDEPTIKTLVEYANMAPSGANSQSWKWLYKSRTLYLFMDILYTAGMLDYDNTTSIIGIGTATENLILKAHEMNFEVELINPSIDKDSLLISVFRFYDSNNLPQNISVEPHVCDELSKSIPERHTNRNINTGKRTGIDKDILGKLKQLSGTIEGADLILLDKEEDLNLIGEIIAKTDRIRISCKGGHQDFLAEIRWTPEQASYFKNGIDLLNTVDLTPSEHAGLTIVKDWKVMDQLNDLPKGGVALEKIGRKGIAGASVVGLLTMPEYNVKNFYLGGRVIERIWLQANSSGVAFHPVSISTLMFNRVLNGATENIPTKILDELFEIRKEYEKLFNIRNFKGEIMLFRMFLSEQPLKGRSIRYPLEQVLSIVK